MDADPTRRTVAEHLERAELMYDLDRLPDARSEVDAALRIDPFSPDANAMAGVVALAEGDPDEALVFAGAALAHDPQHRRALIVRGYALADAERRDEALQAANSLLELDRRSWIHQVHYALITRRAGAGQPALDAAWNAVNLAPDQPRTHLALAAVAESLDMGDLARRSREAAADLDPVAGAPRAPAAARGQAHRATSGRRRSRRPAVAVQALRAGPVPRRAGPVDPPGHDGRIRAPGPAGRGHRLRRQGLLRPRRRRMLGGLVHSHASAPPRRVTWGPPAR
ncbi:hypothetical protein GCM10029992_18400 [Glycomyces albus]